MSTIGGGISIANPTVNAIDMSKLKLFKVSEASEEFYQSYTSGQEKFLEGRYTSYSGLSDSARSQDYATVQVNGKTVATLDNNGYVETSNGVGSSISQLFGNEGRSLSGPALAQDRATKIAELLGGEVVKSSTALTQNQYRVAPGSQVHRTVDYGAMHQSQMYESLQRTKEARTLFLAQQIGQETAATEGASAKSASNEVMLETSNGQEAVDLDTYFKPNSTTGNVNIKDVSLMLPNAETINALSQHAASKFQGLLKSYGIAKVPAEISYDSQGNIQLPGDYPYKNELKQALDENPDIARELSTISALTSHYVGIQAASQGAGSGGGYAKIALSFDAEGNMTVTADGKSFEGANDHVASTSEAEAWFQNYMDKTPEERMYEALLKEKGLTPEQFEALPPEERLAIEQEIQAEIKKRITDELGTDGSTTEA